MSSAASLGLRGEQEDIVLGYSQGQMGVAAVPGSGKTYTLAHLAARLIYDRRLDLAQEQEVLIVTFTNTAVNSFQARIARILQQQYGLLPHIGYRVRTLHGLAHDIVRERPALVGLADDFSILDERAAVEIQREVVGQHVAEWWEPLSAYLASAEDVNPKSARYRFEQGLPQLITRFISQAKDMRLEPDDLRIRLREIGSPDTFVLARFAANAYADYQRSLSYRGAVDFDDLVRLALVALETDDLYLQRLRARWPLILEDEAQDSSRLQETMLRLLSNSQNWVRVGDPNQAINTTFTTASPEYLLRFLNPDENPGVEEYPLSVSGRSAQPIIDLANELVRWAVDDHPVRDLTDAFTLREHAAHGAIRGVIRPTPPGDPQTNPLASNAMIHIEYSPERRVTPDQELELVVAGEDYALVPWLREIEALPEAERPTVAVLVPENNRGFKLAELLRKYGVEYEELLRSTTATRQAVTLIRTVLDYLANPVDLRNLKQVYWALMPAAKKELVKGDSDLRQAISKIFSEFRNIEDFLWPTADQPELALDGVLQDYPWLREDLEDLYWHMRRWLKAVRLPIDQLVLTISQDLFVEAVDVALGYKIAVVLRGIAQAYPDWRLPEFADELRAISNNERKFIGFDDADEGYEPRPGVPTIATMHAAKGLEWDRVYLLAVSNYGFPSAQSYDSYIGERWYIRDNLNLEAELLAQLEVLTAGDPSSYIEGEATYAARLDYARERLRLLYVGITRARRELVITWNMGRFWQNQRQNQPALPLVALAGFLRQQA
jgi:DNA helicase-2/ATP-dependent DNA helicase PcrA